MRPFVQEETSSIFKESALFGERLFVCLGCQKREKRMEGGGVGRGQGKDRDGSYQRWREVGQDELNLAMKMGFKPRKRDVSVCWKRVGWERKS